jgi:malate dehydrogenase (oxaloacetate-decarboxylating)
MRQSFPGGPVGPGREGGNMAHGSLVRTLRIKSRRKVGNLGLVTSAIGDAGAAIQEITTLRLGHTFAIREFHLLLEDEDHVRQCIAAVNDLNDSEVEATGNPSQEVHLGGKIRTATRVDLSGLTALQTAYNPGVREIIAAIDDDERNAERFTSAPRTVAIVSDGAGLIGVGRVKSRAMLPVLEAKAALLAQFAGLNALPLVLDVQDEEDVIETVKRLVPSCGAILLDAIGGGRGMRVQEALDEALDVPVFDDDSDGPAVAVLAAVINAAARIGKDIKSVKIGQIGLGTAGAAIANLVMTFTGNSVKGEDVHPAALSRHVHRGGEESSLEEIMASCDIVVANTGHADVIPPSMVRDGQAILALSVPRGEIDPYDAVLAGAAFAADGQAINKAVAFPGLLLGALGVRATTLSTEMQIAAALTLAELAPNGDLIPTPQQEGVHAAVAAAVAKAAVTSGVATIDVPEALLTASVFEEAIADERLIPLRVD